MITAKIGKIDNQPLLQNILLISIAIINQKDKIPQTKSC